MLSSALPDKVPHNGNSNRVHRDISQYCDEILRPHITFKLGKLYITATHKIYNILPSVNVAVIVPANSLLIWMDNLFSHPENRTKDDGVSEKCWEYLDLMQMKHKWTRENKKSYAIHFHAQIDYLQYNVQQVYIIATYEIYHKTLQLQHVSVHYGPSSRRKHINQICIKYYS